jgi:methylmalonyl-CoA/ethylmalonyl-CoA epimerase
MHGREMSELLTPNRWGLTFHHLGLAVEDAEPATHFLAGLRYAVGPWVYDPLQNVRLRMCTHEKMPDVEIISRATGKGPLDKLFSAQREGLVYHICYTSANLAMTLEALEAEKDLRVVTISGPKEAVLFNGRRVSFYLIAGMGLIEIIDESA